MVMDLDNKKPALGGLGGRVEFTDYLWIKLIVLVVAAFIYGIYKGFNENR